MFRKYIPILKQVAKAGWHPVTEAVCDNEHIWMERFGPDTVGRLYLTLYNDTDHLQTGTVRLASSAAQAWAGAQPLELVSGQKPASSSDGWRLSLAPGQVAVLRFCR